MGSASEGEEEKVELSDGEVDLLEHEGAAGGDDDDAGGLLPSDDEGDSDEEAGGAVRAAASLPPVLGWCANSVRCRRRARSSRRPSAPWRAPRSAACAS
jgi:hypothetical protein